MALSLGTKARCQAVSHTRTALQGIREIDKHVVKKIQDGFAAKDRRIYNYIASLSCVSNDIMLTYGQAQSGLCAFCKKTPQTIRHLFRTCDKFEHIRDMYEVGAEHLNCEELPEAVVLGIPPALAIHPEETFWGQSHRSFGDKLDIVGCFHKGQRISPANRDRLNTLSGTWPHRCARQAFALLKGFHYWPRLPPPAFCEGAAPSEPNVYSDGGASHPTNPQWTLGSHGIHWAAGLRTQEPTSLEQEFSSVSHDANSGRTDLWGPATGIRCTSTRAELYAAILAMYAPIPIHIAIDNKAVVDIGNIIIQQARQGNASTLVDIEALADSDLWTIFHANVLARGPFINCHL